MSSDLCWLLTRNQSSFLVKRNNLFLNRKSLNSKNSLKFSGIAKPLEISATPSGCIVRTKKAQVSINKPAKCYTSVSFSNQQRARKSVRNIVKGYRPDLVEQSMQKVDRIFESLKPRKQVVAKRRNN